MTPDSSGLPWRSCASSWPRACCSARATGRALELCHRGPGLSGKIWTEGRGERQGRPVGESGSSRLERASACACARRKTRAFRRNVAMRGGENTARRPRACGARRAHTCPQRGKPWGQEARRRRRPGSERSQDRSEHRRRCAALERRPLWRAKSHSTSDAHAQHGKAALRARTPGASLKWNTPDNPPEVGFPAPFRPESQAAGLGSSSAGEGGAALTRAAGSGEPSPSGCGLWGSGPLSGREEGLGSPGRPASGETVPGGGGTCRTVLAKSSSGPSTRTWVTARVRPWPEGCSGLLLGFGASALSARKGERASADDSSQLASSAGPAPESGPCGGALAPHIPCTPRLTQACGGPGGAGPSGGMSDTRPGRACPGSACWGVGRGRAVPRRGGREAVSREWKVWPPDAPLSC